VAAETIFQASLFSTDFLQETITRGADWQHLPDSGVDALAADLRKIFAAFPVAQTPNESQTEDDLIWPVLTQLGWTASLRQQNLAAKGRDDVPDGLLFQDAAKKARANTFPEEFKRYGFGLAIVESKRWHRLLDRQSGRRGEKTAPSTQMLPLWRHHMGMTQAPPTPRRSTNSSCFWKTGGFSTMPMTWRSSARSSSYAGVDFSILPTVT
jgi:hypothetical protein